MIAFGGLPDKMAVRSGLTAMFHSNSALALRKAALAGLGIALLPDYCDRWRIWRTVPWSASFLNVRSNVR